MKKILNPKEKIGWSPFLATIDVLQSNIKILH